MKKTFTILLTSLLLLFIHATIHAEETSYYYEDLVTFSVTKQDSSYFIITTISSNRKVFLKDPIMKVRTSDDELLTFPGVIVINGSTPLKINVDKRGNTHPDFISIAQFTATPEQFELIKCGIVKI